MTDAQARTGKFGEFLGIELNLEITNFGETALIRPTLTFSGSVKIDNVTHDFPAAEILSMRHALPAGEEASITISNTVLKWDKNKQIWKDSEGSRREIYARLIAVLSYEDVHGYHMAQTIYIGFMLVSENYRRFQSRALGPTVFRQGARIWTVEPLKGKPKLPAAP